MKNKTSDRCPLLSGTTGLGQHGPRSLWAPETVPNLDNEEIAKWEDFMLRSNLHLALCLLLISGAILLMAQPAAATTQCTYNFASGIGNTRLVFCVTVNGNIAQIETPEGIHWISTNGEGYGICDQNAPMNYTDYGVSDTGNWNSSTLVSKTTSSVKIARTTSDGHWTLTQTITKVSKTSSISVVMALTNNQAIADTAYLVRFANAYLNDANNGGTNLWVATVNSGLVFTDNNDLNFGAPNYGLILQNVGTPPFFFWNGIAQNVSSGPNACAFAFNDSGGGNISGTGSIEVAYVGNFAAGQTLTANLTYRGY